MESIALTETSLKTAVQKASAVLTQGGIVLYPTDTLYGLAVDATNPHALLKLQLLKGRPDGKAFSVVVDSMDMLAQYAHLTPLASTLAERYLPGALTLVLHTLAPLSSYVSKDDTVALRIPDHPFCLSLARTFGKPYTATSANISGEETKATVAEILAQFGEQASSIDLVIDAGTLTATLGSSVVDACGESPIILRQGSLYIDL